MTNGSAVVLPYRTNTPGLACRMQNGQPFASQEQDQEIQARCRIRILISKFKASPRAEVMRMSREGSEKGKASCRITRATMQAEHPERTQSEQESERNRKLWFSFSKSQPRWTISSRSGNNQCAKTRMKYSNAVKLTSKNTASARLKGVAQHRESSSSSSD